MPGGMERCNAQVTTLNVAWGDEVIRSCRPLAAKVLRAHFGSRKGSKWRILLHRTGELVVHERLKSMLSGAKAS